MTLLLDTSAFIWWVNDDPRLGLAARRDIASPDHKVFVSNLAFHECAIKIRRNKLQIDFDAVDAEISNGALQELRFDTLAARTYTQLPPLGWADPFDMAVMAQAIAKRMTLVTSDHNILAAQLHSLHTLDARK